MSWQTETHQEKISRLRADLEKLQKSLTLAEAELAEMETSMHQFEMDFNEQVGYLLEELALIEAEVEAYNSRIRSRRLGKSIGEGYTSVEDQYDEKWNAPRRHTQKPKVEPLEVTAPVTQARLKKLYRQLARQYHPDLARDEEERAYRTEKMTAINDAYNAGSLVELQAIADEMKRHAPEPPSIIQTAATKATSQQRQPQTEAEMVGVLKDEIDRTNRQLYRVQDALRNFHHRPLVEFALEAKLAARKGHDVLAEMAVDLQRKIARKQAERDMIRTQFDSLSR